MISCSSGCGRQSADAKSFLRCSKCMVAVYCNKKCQIQHWKAGGHKYECFSPLENQIPAVILLEGDPTNKAGELTVKELKGGPGCSVFLGRNTDPLTRRNHRFVILSDYCEEDDEATAVDERLLVPKVPPALVKAVSRDPSFYASAANAYTQALCQKYQNEIIALTSLVDQLNSGYYMKIFELLFSNKFDEKEHAEVLKYIDESLRLVQWSSTVDVPAADNEDMSWLVGKKILLGGGIEMMYITPPGICFAEMNPSEIAWHGEQFLELAVIRLPIVAYHSQEEGWLVTRINQRCCVVNQEKKASIETPTETDLLSLKIFVAAAEIGDIGIIFSSLEAAKRASILHGEEHLFIYAARKLVPLLAGVHPHDKREMSFCLIEIGKAYQSIASRLMDECHEDDAVQKALLSAALAYKEAADMTREFFPSLGLRRASFESLAVTLKQLGDIKMAVRTFMWSFTDPLSYRDGNDLMGCMVAVWRSQFQTTAERRKKDRTSLKRQRAAGKKTPVGAFQRVNCQKCGKKIHETREEMSRCSRCLIPYCSRECQKEDWAEHKHSCTPQGDTTQSVADNGALSSPYEKYTHCPEATREMLAGTNINKGFRMSLSAFSEFVDEFKRSNQGRQVEVQLPDSLRRALLEEIRSGV